MGKRILDILKAPHNGVVRRVRWSYSFEGILEKADRPPEMKKPKIIADIVLSWEDDNGQNLAVIETKRPGGSLGIKDRQPDLYLKLPAFREFNHRHKSFLVCESDIERCTRELPRGSNIATWQQIAQLQCSLAETIPTLNHLRGLLSAYVRAHYSDLNVRLDSGPLQYQVINKTKSVGTRVRFDEIQSLGLPSQVEDFLLGSELTFSARRGLSPDPPYEWLSEEPTCIEVWERGLQKRPLTRTDRFMEPLWLLS